MHACTWAHGQGLTLPSKAFPELVTHWAVEAVPELSLCSDVLDRVIPRLFARRAQLSSHNLIVTVRAQSGSAARIS
jgi:hypothetical protein